MVNDRADDGFAREGVPVQAVDPHTANDTTVAEFSAQTDAATPQETLIPEAQSDTRFTARDPGAEIDFPGKEPHELFRFYFRQHWIRLAAPVAKAAGWTLLLFFASFTRYVGFPLDDVTRRFILVPLTLFFVLFQMQLLRKWYEYFLHVIVVSDLKIHRMKQRFLLMENDRSVDIPTIRDVKREQRGPFQLLLGFGSILLDTAQGELRIHFVPDLRTIREALLVKREEVRSNGGHDTQQKSQTGGA